MCRNGHVVDYKSGKKNRINNGSSGNRNNAKAISLTNKKFITLTLEIVICQLEKKQKKEEVAVVVALMVAAEEGTCDGALLHWYKHFVFGLKSIQFVSINLLVYSIIGSYLQIAIKKEVPRRTHEMHWIQNWNWTWKKKTMTMDTWSILNHIQWNLSEEWTVNWIIIA